jgi:hypothetical protein
MDGKMLARLGAVVFVAVAVTATSLLLALAAMVFKPTWASLRGIL